MADKVFGFSREASGRIHKATQYVEGLAPGRKRRGRSNSLAHLPFQIAKVTSTITAATGTGPGKGEVVFYTIDRTEDEEKYTEGADPPETVYNIGATSIGAGTRGVMCFWLQTARDGMDDDDNLPFPCWVVTSALDEVSGYGVLRAPVNNALTSSTRFIALATAELVNSDELSPVVAAVPVSTDPLAGWDALEVKFSGAYLIGLNLTTTHLTTSADSLVLTVTGDCPAGGGPLTNGVTSNGCDHINIQQATIEISKNGKAGEGASNDPQSRVITVVQLCNKVINANLCITWPIELDAGDRIRVRFNNTHGLSTDDIMTLDWVELWIASQGPSFTFTGES